MTVRETLDMPHVIDFCRPLAVRTAHRVITLATKLRDAQLSGTGYVAALRRDLGIVMVDLARRLEDLDPGDPLAIAAANLCDVHVETDPGDPEHDEAIAALRAACAARPARAPGRGTSVQTNT